MCVSVSVCVPCTSSACNLVTAGGVVHKDTPLWGPWTATPRAGLGVGGDRDLCSRSVCGNRKPGESSGQSGQEGLSDDLGRLFPEGGSAAEARLGPGQVGTPLPPARSPALQTPEFWVRPSSGSAALLAPGPSTERPSADHPKGLPWASQSLPL